MERLSLDTHGISSATFEARIADEENGLVENLQPRKRARQNAQDLLSGLENEFLEPSNQFGTKWLNALQK